MYTVMMEVRAEEIDVCGAYALSNQYLSMSAAEGGNAVCSGSQSVCDRVHPSLFQLISP